MDHIPSTEGSMNTATPNWWSNWSRTVLITVAVVMMTTCVGGMAVSGVVGVALVSGFEPRTLPFDRSVWDRRWERTEIRDQAKRMAAGLEKSKSLVGKTKAQIKTLLGEPNEVVSPIPSWYYESPNSKTCWQYFIPHRGGYDTHTLRVFLDSRGTVIYAQLIYG